MKILLQMTRMQFKMLLRNKGLMLSSLGVAVISMLIFGALFGSNNAQPVQVGVVDLDRSPLSGQAVATLRQNQTLKITEGEQAALLAEVKDNKRAAVLVLQPGFGAALPRAEARAELYVDESDLIGAARTRGTIYATLDGLGKSVAGFKDLIQIEEKRVQVRQQRQIDILTPGMLGLTIMFANMPVGVALISWRERGTLKRLSATPLRAWQLIGSQIISQLALSFVQAAIILGLAATVFGVQLEAAWLPAIALFVIAGTFSIISLGYAVGNFVKKQEAAASTVTLISLPMMFLGGSYFPVDPPVFLQPLVEALPLTHLNRAFRQIMLNGVEWSALLLNLGVLVAFGLLLLTLSIRTFRWNS